MVDSENELTDLCLDVEMARIRKGLKKLNLAEGIVGSVKGGHNPWEEKCRKGERSQRRNPGGGCASATAIH